MQQQMSTPDEMFCPSECVQVSVCVLFVLCLAIEKERRGVCVCLFADVFGIIGHLRQWIRIHLRILRIQMLEPQTART